MPKTTVDLEEASRFQECDGLSDDEKQVLLRECMEKQKREIQHNLGDIQGLTSGLFGGQSGKGKGKGCRQEWPGWPKLGGRRAPNPGPLCRKDLPEVSQVSIVWYTLAVGMHEVL